MIHKSQNRCLLQLHLLIHLFQQKNFHKENGFQLLINTSLYNINHKLQRRGMSKRNQISSVNNRYSIVDLEPKDFLDKLFSKFDLDHNGRISKFQFHDILKVLTKLTGAAFPNSNDIDDIFNHIDTDGDKTISHSEYCQLVNGFTSLLEEQHIKLKFKKMLV